MYATVWTLFSAYKKNIYMNSPCRGEGECQDYSKCDRTDETACGWWAYDRQVTDSAVSTTWVCTTYNAAEAPKHRAISKARFSPPWEARHPAWSSESSRGERGICAFLMPQTRVHCTHWRDGNGADNTFNRIPWCVLYVVCFRNIRETSSTCM